MKITSPFMNGNFIKFATDKQFKHTSIACPQANGQVERNKRTILNALCASDLSLAANK